jgi:hypothetical protein
MIPEIVENKINWYIWRKKQRDICVEYKEKASITKITVDNIWRRESIQMRWRNKKESVCKCYNWRVLIEEIPEYIKDRNGKIVGKLSKNY